jgi:putative endopeptidase
MLDERSNAVQQQLAEQAAADPHATGVEQVGDFWPPAWTRPRSTPRASPAQAELAAIDGVRTGQAGGLPARQRRQGPAGLFGFGAEADFKDSANNIAYASQGGLGLPDRSTTPTPKTRTSWPPTRRTSPRCWSCPAAAADAAKQAKDVMAFETRLAKASKSARAVARRLAVLQPGDAGTGRQADPELRWTEFFKSQGVAPQPKFSLASPAFHEEVSKMLGDTDPAAWRAYLRFHAVDGARRT